MSRVIYQGVTVTGPMRFVEIVENTLGWLPEGGSPMRARQRHAAILKRKIEDDPKLYCWANLLLALEYVRRRQLDISTPVSLCWFVQPALREAAVPVEVSDIEQAIEVELTQQRQGWRQWVRRLDRARGANRAEIYREWQASRVS